MVDTLEITKKLEGAGFARGQAEAMAAIMAGGAGERDKQLDELSAGLAEVGTHLARVEQRIATFEQRVETLIAKSRTEQIIWTIGALGVLAALLRLFP